MEPLISILIPAYNTEKWITQTLQSAVGQTWRRKEIIVVDDGSTDRTAELARRFASKEVAVFSTGKQGAAAARNHAYKLCQGDYIQWLDADDLLAPDKIERQLTGPRSIENRKILLSGPMGFFYHRPSRAQFVPTALWQDLSPAEWLICKLSWNLRMSVQTWLTSRELAEAAGPWDTLLHFDDDGEYFSRVLLASGGTHFVHEARAFTRKVPSRSRVSYIGASNDKRVALLRSMKLHIQYLRSLQESERVRSACVAYLQSWYDNFYAERTDIAADLRAIAAELHGRLEVPRLGWKYAWIKPFFGWKVAKEAQTLLPLLKVSCISFWDKAMYQFAGGGLASGRGPVKISDPSRN